MNELTKIEQIMDDLRALRDNQVAIECTDHGSCVCNEFDLILDSLSELRSKFIKAQIKYLESILPNIEERHEREGTIEVIQRLEAEI